jgi:hypothetical protein
MVKDYLSRPIIDRQEIGSIRPGETRESVISKIGMPGNIRGEGKLEFFDYPSLMVVFVSGRVEDVIATVGYKGKTPDGVGIGTTWKELKSKYPYIYFEEEFGLWQIQGKAGLGFALMRPPGKDDEADKPLVDEIWLVKDPEHAFVGEIFVFEVEDYLSLPIIDGQVIGGIRPGETRESVISKLEMPAELVEQDGGEFFDYPGLAIDIKSARVKEVMATAGYLGKTKDGVGIGTTWKELKAKYPDIYFEEEFGLWQTPGMAGMGFALITPPRHDGKIDKPLIEVKDPEHTFVGEIHVL